ncbi:hypothetical protein AVEN_209512-1 [Araneus ventricosus]|uniref:CCHC-type domain-containing protein n=1 Tax=Araneus ventricosus TaxID=182803 RepID=A0A4Y2IMT3_ARAVE|nr:hypothetical protein AVEN_209512-1 [Araneus ventricosus]
MEQGSDLQKLSGVTGSRRDSSTRKTKGTSPQSDVSGEKMEIAEKSSCSEPVGMVGPPLVQRPGIPTLPPRQLLSTLVVTPIGETIASSAQLQTLLESMIHPQNMGVDVLSCLPAANRGVLLCIRTPEMRYIIETAINIHTGLKDVCVAREPRGRNPRILVYDVPVTGGNRETEEAAFLQKLRYSNSISDETDIRALFWRPGRGPFQHWVPSVAPEYFHTIKDTNRVFFGFGSLKFREYLEPTRCYKCLKFGHLRANCGASQELCTKCTGAHSYKECTAPTVVCRHCTEYNRRRRTGPRVRTDHSAISVRCPIYIRERKKS